MIVPFSKYEGAGNDFILLDAREYEFTPTSKFIISLCDRHKGIGADGVIVLDLSNNPAVDFRMRYYNADGGEGTMCGNGGRCITLFAHYLGIGGREKRFEGIDGIHRARVLTAENNSGFIEIGILDNEGVTMVDGDYLTYTGSNHLVRFVDNVDGYDVDGIGRALCHAPQFDHIEGVNVNFVEIVGDGELKVRTFERGVENETLACGTGATASAIVARKHMGSSVCHWTIHAPGGDLVVRFDSEGERTTNILLTGPARRVFTGKIDTTNLR